MIQTLGLPRAQGDGRLWCYAFLCPMLKSQELASNSYEIYLIGTEFRNQVW
jgi:hypothetical protein